MSWRDHFGPKIASEHSKFQSSLIKLRTSILAECTSSADIKLLGSGLRDVLSNWEKNGGTLANNPWSAACVSLSSLFAEVLNNQNESIFISYSKLLLFSLSKCKAFAEGTELHAYLQVMATTIRHHITNNPSKSMSETIGKLLMYLLQVIAEQFSFPSQDEVSVLLSLFDFTFEVTTLRTLSNSVPSAQHDAYFIYLFDNALSWALDQTPERLTSVLAAYRTHLVHTCYARQFDTILRHLAASKDNKTVATLSTAFAAHIDALPGSKHNSTIAEISKLCLIAIDATLEKTLMANIWAYIEYSCESNTEKQIIGWKLCQYIVDTKHSSKASLNNLATVAAHISEVTSLDWDLLVKIALSLMMDDRGDMVLDVVKVMPLDAVSETTESGIYKLFVTVLRYGIQIGGEATDILLRMTLECISALALGVCRRQNLIDNLLKLSYTALKSCHHDKTACKVEFVSAYISFITSPYSELCSPTLAVGLSSQITSKWENIDGMLIIGMILHTFAFIDVTNGDFVSELKYLEKTCVSKLAQHILSDNPEKWSLQCSVSTDRSINLILQLIGEVSHRISQAAVAPSLNLLCGFDSVAKSLLLMCDISEATVVDAILQYGRCQIITSLNDADIASEMLNSLSLELQPKNNSSKKTAKGKKPTASIRNPTADLLTILSYIRLAVGCGSGEPHAIHGQLSDDSFWCDRLRASLAQMPVLSSEIAIQLFHYFSLCADFPSQRELLSLLRLGEHSAVSGAYRTLKPLLEMQLIVHGMLNDVCNDDSDTLLSRFIRAALELSLGGDCPNYSTSRAFEVLAEEVYSSYRNDSSILPCWIALTCSKLLFLRWNTCVEALTWAKRCLSLTGLNSRHVDVDFILPAFECTLLIAEMHEATGSLDRCQAYIAESRLLAATTTIPLLCNLQALHAYRLGYRLQQEKLMEDNIGVASGSHICPLQSDFAQLLNTARDAVAGETASSDFLSNSFRFMNCLWDCGVAVHPHHTPLHVKARKVLVDAIKSVQPIRGIQFSGTASSVSPRHIDESLLVSDFFDAARTYRKIYCNELLSSNSPLACILASSTCGTAVECSLELQADSSPSISPVTQAAKMIRLAVTGDNAAVDNILSLLTSKPNRTICFLTMDPISKALYIGRVSANESPAIVALPINDDVLRHVEIWKQMLEQNRCQLRSVCDTDSKVDKKAWWNQRAAFEKNIESSLIDIQNIFGAWRCMFAQPTSYNVDELHRAILRHVSTIIGKQNKKYSSNIEHICASLVQWCAIIFSSDAALSTEELICAMTSLCAQLFEPIGVEWSAQSLQAIVSDVRELFEDRQLCEISEKMAEMSTKDENSLNNVNLIAEMKVTELKNELKNLGLSVTGKKAELVERLTAHYSASAPSTPLAQHTCTSATSNYHTVLMCDENLQLMPWECLPILRNRSCSRVPGLCTLLSLQIRMQNAEKYLHAQHSWYSVDPEDNLPQTRKTMESFLEPYAKKWQWQGCVGQLPSEEFVRSHHENSDIFIYCGHGAGEKLLDRNKLKKTKCPAAMLWGCSSGALTRHGIHDPNGAALAYLLGGAPWVVGNLWDVTDKDIDKLSMSHMKRLLEAGSGAAESLCSSRNECKLIFANGCAPVIYGLPDDARLAI